MRLKGEHTFTIKGDPQKVFEYASDFSNIDAWDPGKLMVACAVDFFCHRLGCPVIRNTIKDAV